LFGLNDLIRLHLLRLFLENSSRCQFGSLSFPQLDRLLRLLRLFEKLENSFSCQFGSSLFLPLVLRLDSQLHLQAHSLARHLLGICSDPTPKSLLFPQSLRFPLQPLSHLLDRLLEMLGIYAENSSKGPLFLRLVPRRVSIPLMTHLVTHPVAHLATHQLGILAERPPEMPLFSPLGHLALRMAHDVLLHLVVHLQEPPFMTHLLEPPLVIYLPSQLAAHLRVYSLRIYTSCFIDSAKKITRHRFKGNASFPSSHIVFLSKSRFRPSLFHHRVL